MEYALEFIRGKKKSIGERKSACPWVPHGTLFLFIFFCLTGVVLYFLEAYPPPGWVSLQHLPTISTRQLL